MTRAQCIQRLIAGIRADLADYRRLRELLERQFTAALRHRAEDTQHAVAGILELTTVLNGRRRDRVDWVGSLSAGAASPSRLSVRSVSVHLPPEVRPSFDACCHELEKLVRECKRLNRRNRHLITTQQDIMRQVLNPQSSIYAPA